MKPFSFFLSPAVLPAKPKIYFEVSSSQQQQQQQTKIRTLKREGHRGHRRHRRDRLNRGIGKHSFVEVSDGQSVGPFDEGDNVRFKCIVNGGRPLPNVTWWEKRTGEEKGKVSIQVIDSW